MQSTTSSTRTFRTSSTQTDPKPPKRSPKLPKVPKLAKPKLPKVPGLRLAWVLIIILVVISLFLFQQYREARQKLAAAHNPNAVNAQVKNVITAVRKLVVLPSNQTPTVATVQNVSKLRGQSFFANAKNGDKVLVYSAEKEAILYRPSTNQIVTIAPISVNGSTNP
ncbi:MAG TPA: hypothetical protein VG992_03915 [Candidatus Saccharimonadales bacterium]|nr:hypothetical protein [Candidatus Saccharimonadales bacterium]